MNCSHFQAALASGFAETQAPTRESGNHFVPAGQRPPCFVVHPGTCVGVRAPQVEGQLFASPNAIRSAPPPTTNWLLPQPVRAALS
jgi:hypothetical protein